MEKKQRPHLKTEIQGFFMEETSPLNPYGPNYYFLAYDTKVYNKFVRVKRHVHLTPEDTETLVKGNVYYFCGMISSFLFGLTLGIALKRLFINRFIRMNELVEDHPRIYYGLFGSCLTTIGYSYLTDYYIMQLCYPMIGKYLDKAIENGFEDYEIDETHKNNKIIYKIKKFLNFSV